MANLRPAIILSDEQLQFLNGCLLGDGNLKKWKNFRYSSSKLDHVEYVYSMFIKLASPKFKNGPVKKDNFSKKTGKIYTQYDFETQCNITFRKLRQKWYPEDKKIVPRDLKLTQLTCLMWYVGDGSLEKKSQTITLSTNGFVENDVDFLVKLLNELDFEARKQSKKHQYIIYIPRRKTQKFLDYICSCPIKSYTYKWNYKSYIRPILPKKILQIDENGNFIKEWSSTGQVQKILGYDRGFILKCCLGKHKKAYGFIWEFA